MKNNISKLIIKRWYLFLIWLMVSYSICTFTLSRFNQPKQEKEIKVFVGAFNENNSTLTTKFNDLKDEHIKRVSVDYFAPQEDYFNAYLSVYMEDTDLFILGEKEVNSSIVSRFIEVDIIDATLSNYQCFKHDDKNYGVELFNFKNNSGPLVNYFESTNVDENYYVFFNKSSIHISDNTDKYAIKLIKDLLKQ